MRLHDRESGHWTQSLITEFQQHKPNLFSSNDFFTAYIDLSWFTTYCRTHIALGAKKCAYRWASMPSFDCQPLKLWTINTSDRVPWLGCGIITRDMLAAVMARRSLRSGTRRQYTWVCPRPRTGTEAAAVALKCVDTRTPPIHADVIIIAKQC